MDKKLFNTKSLNDVAEYLGKNMDEYSQKLITWDYLTYDLLGLPKHKGEISKIAWIQKRPVWITKINEHFETYEYPCKLFVEGKNKGARLYVKKLRNSEQMKRGTKKVLNTSTTAIKRAEELKNTSSAAEKKYLDIYIRSVTEATFALIGRLSIDPRIAGALGDILELED